MSTHTVGLRTISATDDSAPVMMAQTAPVVLNRRQTIDSRSGGKFALAATANVSPTMNATFCPLNGNAEQHGHRAEHDRGHPRDADLLVLGRLALPHDVQEDVVRQRAGAGEREPGDHGQNRGERHGGDEAEERRAAQQLRHQRRRHVAAGVDPRESRRGRPAPTRRSRRSG